jgi:hypothetical protein
VLAGEAQHLGDVKRPPAGVALLDLMTAREAVGDHELRRPRLPDRGQQRPFATCL